MLNRGLFRKPKNDLEGSGKLAQTTDVSVPDEMCVACPSCKRTLFSYDLSKNANVCPFCEHHFRMNARERLNLILDETGFVEMDEDLQSANVLDFPEYDKKLKHARLESAEKEGVITGTGTIDGYPCAIFVMEPYFMVGSMGTVIGEKITRLFEHATRESLPVIGYTVSGGARMQEGILSLMQMAKVSGAVKRHSEAGNLYVVVLTDPTMGGVTASFAMQGDIIVAEPGALVGFAGPRVIEQTIRQKLPEGFQRAEFLMQTGFVDEIVGRRRQRAYLATLLRLHQKEAMA